MGGGGVNNSRSFRLRDEIDNPFLSHIFVTDNSGNRDSYEISLTCIRREPKKVPKYDPEELNGVCQFLFSSGTTGKAKPIKVTCEMMIHSCRRNSYPGCTEYSRSISLVTQPLTHVGGLIFGVMVGVYNGATIVLADYPGSLKERMS